MTLQHEVAVHSQREVLEHNPFFDFAIEQSILAEIEAFITLFSPSMCTPGEFLFHRGDLGKQLYFLREGSLEFVFDHSEPDVVEGLAHLAEQEEQVRGRSTSRGLRARARSRTSAPQRGLDRRESSRRSVFDSRRNLGALGGADLGQQKESRFASVLGASKAIGEDMLDRLIGLQDAEPEMSVLSEVTVGHHVGDNMFLTNDGRENER